MMCNMLMGVTFESFFMKTKTRNTILHAIQFTAFVYNRFAWVGLRLRDENIFSIAEFDFD